MDHIDILFLNIRRKLLTDNAKAMRSCIKAYESGDLTMDILMAIYRRDIIKIEKELLDVETQLIAANES